MIIFMPTSISIFTILSRLSLFGNAVNVLEDQKILDHGRNVEWEAANPER